MQPFTLDQAIVAGLLFLLGLLIGMFLFAGGKWKHLYRNEAARREGLEREVELLHRERREHETLRNAAARAPAHPAGDTVGTHHAATEEHRVITHPAPAQEQRVVTETRTAGTAEPYRRVDPAPGGDPDIVIRRP